MKKLKLDLDDIRVESFDTTPDGLPTMYGTIRGQLTQTCDESQTCNGGSTCNGTCEVWPTCGGAFTCDGQCPTPATQCNPTDCSPNPCGPNPTGTAPTCRPGCESGESYCSVDVYTCDATCYQFNTCEFTGPNPACC